MPSQIADQLADVAMIGVSVLVLTSKQRIQTESVLPGEARHGCCVSVAACLILQLWCLRRQFGNEKHQPRPPGQRLVMQTSLACVFRSWLRGSVAALIRVAYDLGSGSLSYP